MTVVDYPACGPQRKFSCLLVEDDAAFAAMVAQIVRQEGGEPTIVGTLSGARDAVANRSFQVILLDNHLPDGKAYDFFEQFSRRNPEAPVLMITGVPDLSEAVRLTRNGLFDYVTKPVTVDGLSSCLRRAKSRLEAQALPGMESEWFGDSPAMKVVTQQLRQAARHPATTVLLTGETGVGKDLAASYLHQLTFGDRPAPFVAVNCAAVPAEMFESELFGAERGAYTGAEKRRTGLVAAAAEGTLFLDEIADVPLGLQPKLLRLLEAREYRILGSVEGQSFSGRFVAATNKTLAQEVKAGRFREDLLFRLDVFMIELPPLRRRRADIPGLAELLLGQLAHKYKRTKPVLNPEDLARLARYNFPGNVRELRNLLERSLLKTPDENRWLALDSGCLERGTTPRAMETPLQEGAVLQRELTPFEAEEYRLIREAMVETRGGIRRAAARLAMSPQALLRRLEKWPELRGKTT
jgi:DNA-binding NtrC family response regulator